MSNREVGCPDACSAVIRTWSPKKTGATIPWIDVARADIDDRDIDRLSCLAASLVSRSGLVVDLSAIEIDPSVVIPQSLCARFRGPVVVISSRPVPQGVEQARNRREAARIVQGRNLDGVDGDALPELTQVLVDPGVLAEVDVVVNEAGRRRVFLKLTGHYPDGSAGRTTAAFISAVLDVDVMRERPDAIVIDLSSFHYEWGDDLDLYPCGFEVGDPPIRFIASKTLAAAVGIRTSQIASSRAEAEASLDELA